MRELPGVAAERMGAACRVIFAVRSDPGGSPVAVVSHRAWTTHFGRDASIVGRAVRLGPRAFTVVGVAANRLPGPPHDRIPGSR